MSIISFITAIANVFVIFILALGLFRNFQNPKSKAIYGYAIAGGMIPYMFFLSIYTFLNAFTTKNFWSLLLIICVLSPFIIGKLVKYETLKKYTFFQILFFGTSLAFIILNSIYP